MTRIVLSCTIVAALLAGGCGRTQEQKKIEEMAHKAEDAGKAFQQGTQGIADALKGLGDAANDGKKVEPVDFRELKALLPGETVRYDPRRCGRGEGFCDGVKMSEAHANYVSSTGAASATVKITDMGSVSGLVGMATMAWASRTSTVRPRPATNARRHSTDTKHSRNTTPRDTTQN